VIVPIRNRFFFKSFRRMKEGRTQGTSQTETYPRGKKDEFYLTNGSLTQTEGGGWVRGCGCEVHEGESFFEKV